MRETEADIHSHEIKYTEEQLQQERNKDIVHSIAKIYEKFEGRYKKLTKRLQTLVGDSIILAASVCYLGIFSLRERITIRNLMSETLSLAGIESSAYWNEEREFAHCALFKKIVCDMLGERVFFRLSHLVHENHFAEFLFSLCMAPSLPVLHDSAAYFKNHISGVQHTASPDEENCFLGNVRVVPLSAADYYVEPISKSYLDQDNILMLLSDVQDLATLQEDTAAKTQDKALLAGTNFYEEVMSRKKIALGGGDFARNLCDNGNQKEQSGVGTPGLFRAALVSENLRFEAGKELMAVATVIGSSHVNKNEAWIEIKQIFLKHFLPDNHQKIVQIRAELLRQKERIVVLERSFESILLSEGEGKEQLKTEQREALKLKIDEIRYVQEEFQALNSEFHTIINEHPLLASYSNIFVIVRTLSVRLSHLSLYFCSFLIR